MKDSYKYPVSAYVSCDIMATITNAPLESREAQDKMKKKAAIRALTISIRVDKGETSDNIIKRFNLSESDVRPAAQSIYTLRILEGKEDDAARIAQHFKLGDEFVAAPAEHIYDNHVRAGDDWSAAKTAMQFKLPEVKLNSAVESILFESMLKSNDRKKVYVPSTDEILLKFRIKPEKVVEIAQSVYDLYFKRGDFFYAALTAKDYKLDIEKQRSAAEKAYEKLLKEYSHGMGTYQKKAAEIARSFGLGAEKQNEAVNAALLDQIGYMRHDCAEETAKKFGVDKAKLKEVATSAYARVLEHGGYINAMEILRHYKLEIPKKGREALVLKCYDGLIESGRYADAVNLALDEGLDAEIVKAAVMRGYTTKKFQEEWLGAARFIDSAVDALTARNYHSIVPNIKVEAEEAANRAFRLHLEGSHDYRTSEADKIANEFSMSPERQRKIADEVYDSAKNVSRPNYYRLLEIATKYGLAQEKIDAALERSYAEALGYSYSKAEDVAKTYNMPKIKEVEVQDNALLAMLRKGNESEAVDLIIKIGKSQGEKNST